MTNGCGGRWTIRNICASALFEDNNPKGFGLMQRDRNPEHYLDFEAYYEQRPSVWVEPLDQWGEGTVQLIEIPSLQEIHDNVVAFGYPNSRWRQERNIVSGIACTGRVMFPFPGFGKSYRYLQRYRRRFGNAGN